MKRIILLFFPVFLFYCCGEPGSTSQEPAAESPAATTESSQEAVAEESLDLSAGKKVYTTYCLTCHQNDGLGVPGMNPPLAETDWVTGDKDRLINIVLNGMFDPIEVNGERYAGVMAPHRDLLSDEEVAQVLTYIRNSFGNQASAISEAEVAAIRAKG
ncbi:MAG: cytochrome c [Bacteroidota bacterium]